MPSRDAILELIHRMVRSEHELSLRAIAKVSGWSAFYVHRAFRASVGETPKRYQRRLRLQRALVLLMTHDEPVGVIAERAGFSSHAQFSRTFRAMFGCPPGTFRTQARRDWTPQHALQMEIVSRCVGLFGLTYGNPTRRTPMPIDIRIETRPAQPMLYIQRRVAPSQLSETFAECLPAVFAYCQTKALPLAGAPFARYAQVGRGLLTVECGMPIAVPAAGEGAIMAGELYGGDVAVAVHAGPYETLHETHATVERWIVDQGRTPAGAPWESYVTDPADHPDPADWKTEVVWPL